MTRPPSTQPRFGLALQRSPAFLAITLWVMSALVPDLASSQTSPLPIQAHTSTGVDGVAFSKGVHGDLLADMFLPAVEGSRPAVLYLHGGAWKSGDRSQLRDVAVFLADRGYVGMAIDYDLTDRGDRFPIALKESEQAVRWLRRNAVRYGVNPGKIAVVGSSAGGELAALVALDSASAEDARVQAAVVFNGVLDLSYAGPDAEDMVLPYLGKSCAEDDGLCRRASPVDQVHHGAPPFFVGHGTADRIIPYGQAEHFVRLLKENGVMVTPFVARNAGHTYWKSPLFFESNLVAVLSFLHSVMP